MPHGARGPSCGDGRVLGVLDYWLVTVVGVASPENGEIVISNGMQRCSQAVYPPVVF